MEYTEVKSKLWTKDFLLVNCITFLAMTAITTQMGTLPLYVTALGGSKAVAGSIVGILGISALFFRLPIGILLDRYGRRLLLTIGLGILFLDFALLNVLQTLLMLFCLRLIQGIGNSIQATSAATMAADLIPKEQLSVGLGYFSIAQAVPGAIGPLLGLAVVEAYGFEALFRVALLSDKCRFCFKLFFKYRIAKNAFFWRKAKDKDEGRSVGSVVRHEESWRDISESDYVSDLLCEFGRHRIYRAVCDRKENKRSWLLLYCDDGRHGSDSFSLPPNVEARQSNVFDLREHTEHQCSVRTACLCR